ncbi:hypothetical protein KJ992_00805, partial [Patescibacteria group bacterium]|nr:hypothetical protein [Patescibacteria group bacterium]
MHLKSKILKYILLYSGLFAMFCLFFIFTNTGGTAGQSSPDAIAIRVMPNPNYFSPGRWYKDQGFTGSPQSLTVDGYEAVRDGRTAYVNAANIDNNGTTIYTNIYIISYNQNPEPATVDIFGKILKHWKFNSNITDTGQCSVSSIICNNDGSCADGHECDNSNNKCVLNDKNIVNCFIDAECPPNLFCNSSKAKIIRDVKRLSEFVGVNETIEKYRWVNNHYPKLSAGTYLPNKTVSTWPSWDETLGAELGTSLPRDLINRLGNCGDSRFHPVTCWDNLTKEFAGTTTPSSQFDTPDQLELPVASSAYVYTVKPDGSAYSVCGVMESGYFTTLGQGACVGSEKIPQYHGVTDNHNPVITCGALQGLEGSEFIGYISAYDRDDDELAWTLDPLATSWLTPSNLQDTDRKNYKKIYATKAGNKGDYSVKITVADNREGVATTTCSINVRKGVVIIMPVDDQVMTCSIDLVIDGYDPDERYPLTFNFSSNPSLWVSSLACTEIKNGGQCRVKHLMDDATPDNYIIKVDVKNTAGETASTSFNLEIEFNDHPQISENNSPYTYTASTTNPLNLKVFTAIDNSVDYPLTYNLTSGTFPAGWTATFNKNNDNQYIYNVSGIIDLSVALTSITTPYSFVGDVKDKCGNTSPANFVINVINHAPVIEPIDNITKIVPSNINISWNMTVKANDAEANKIIYSISGQPDGVVINKFTGEISGVIVIESESVKTYNIIVKATDDYNAYSEESFVLTIDIRNPPEITSTCSSPTKVNPVSSPTANPYNCSVTAKDGVLPIAYTLGEIGTSPTNNILPISKLSINRDTGIISGYPDIIATHNLTIVATDSVSRSDTQDFNLKVVSYCGDGAVQNPNGWDGNQEECDMGGSNSNTGQCNTNCKKTYCGDNIIQSPNGFGVTERCDTTAGVATSPATSNINNQYSCAGNCGSTTGGYCGDAIVQTVYTEQCEGAASQPCGGGTQTCANCRWNACILSPVVTSANPNTGIQGSLGFTVQVIGSNFQNGATVTFSGAGITKNLTSFSNSG